jgi:hypothetical protein
MVEMRTPLIGKQIVIVVAVFTQTLDDGPNKLPAKALEMI